VVRGAVPGLALLAETDNAMAEYGFRHRLPGIGRDEVQAAAGRAHAAGPIAATEVAAVLDRYPGSRYAQFFQDHSEVADPFLYEARVHIFSRDGHLNRLTTAPPGSSAAREHATMAFRQQLLLERVFGTTLARSSFTLDPVQRQWLEALDDPQRTFASKTASHLITAVSERNLRITLLAAAGILLALDVLVHRRQP